MDNRVGTVSQWKDIKFILNNVDSLGNFYDEYMLQSECLCLPQIHTLNLKAQGGDALKRWGNSNLEKLPCPPHPALYEVTGKDGHLGSRLQPATMSAKTIIVNVAAFRNCEK